MTESTSALLADLESETTQKSTNATNQSIRDGVIIFITMLITTSIIFMGVGIGTVLEKKQSNLETLNLSQLKIRAMIEEATGMYMIVMICFFSV